MKKVLALTATAVAVVLVGCGSDDKSCSTTSAAVAPSGQCTTLRANSDVTVRLRPPAAGSACQSCRQTNPTCDFDPATNHLDTIYRECTEDADCGSGCLPTQPTFSCSFRTPAASGISLFYNTAGGSISEPVEVNLTPDGDTLCTL